MNNDSKKPQQKCAQCGNNHLTFTCKTFIALPVSDRLNKIRAAKHCVKCLNRHTKGEQCTFGPCKHCQKEHNHMLCLQHGKEKREQPAQEQAAKPTAQQQPER